MNSFADNLLVDAEWLNTRLGDSQLRVIDVRGGDPRQTIGYRLGHIPGAIALNPGRDFFVLNNNTFTIAPPDQVAQALGRYGITNDSTVVIYDETIDQLAALTYWILRYLGHREIKVLDGGWIAWQKSGNIVARAQTQFAPVDYRARVIDEIHADAEWIQSNLEHGDVLLLDARSINEYAMGHIPGAVNLPYEQNIDLRTFQLKDAATIRAQLEAIGASADKTIVVYCHTGFRSSHMFLVLSALNYPHVRNYNGSMADWYEQRRLPIDFG